MRDAIDAMRDAFGQLSAGTAEVPVRTSVSVPERDAVTLVMPGRCDVPYGLGGKLVSVFPQNVDAGLPVVNAVVVLLDPETGQVAALLEGGALTAIRTGAASGLATELLARPDAKRAAIIGAGVQAQTQLEAVCCVREIESVAVYALAGAEQFAQEMAGRDGVPAAIRVAGSAHVVIRAGGGRWRRDVRNAHQRDRCVHARDAGDRSRAGGHGARVRGSAGGVSGGLLAEGDLIELGEVVNGKAAGRQSDDQITLFKSVGVAVQDLCAGARAVQGAEALHLGSVIEL
jgi:ornithine cyclodeaminase/alanine dehydrogenase-like protein (mu-crystallin family)